MIRTGEHDRRALLLDAPHTEDRVKRYIVMTVNGGYSMSEDDAFNIRKKLKQKRLKTDEETCLHFAELSLSGIRLMTR